MRIDGLACMVTRAIGCNRSKVEKKVGKLTIFSSFCSFAKGPRSSSERDYT